MSFIHMKTERLNLHLFYILNGLALILYATVLHNLKEVRVSYDILPKAATKRRCPKNCQRAFKC
jgi:hypothetical protein